MKVIHSYVDKYNTLWKELCYTQYLSAVLAKKHYGNISFVSTPEIIEVVSKIGIPYTDYIDNLLEQSDVDTWSIGKIKVFSSTKEPFLHIDNDTFIFDKIDFSSYRKPFIFSHPDLAGVAKYGSGLGTDLSKLVNTLNSAIDGAPDFTYDLNNTYTRLFFKLISDTDPEILTNFDLSSIPNMNIVYVEDYNTFNKVGQKALDHYYRNKQVIDSEEFGPCYIEQLMLHQILRTDSKEYRKYSYKNKHVVFKRIPFGQLDQFNNVPNVDDVRFPFRGKLTSICKCCNQSFKKTIKINSRENIKEFLDIDFNGFLHLTYLKWYDIFQAFTIHKLRQLEGDDQIRKVYAYFKELNPKMNLPIKSGGEKLYEELTNFSFE